MKQSPSQLRLLCERTGISLRELARQIGEGHSNVVYWERSGKIPRSYLLVPIAKALGTIVEELPGTTKREKISAPAVDLCLAFEAVSKLPRRQQKKILEAVNALVAHNSKKNLISLDLNEAHSN